MLTAQTKSGKRICLGYDVKKETLLSLRNNEEFVCPICGEAVLLKLGNQRVFHFAHKHGSNCESLYENESVEHMQGKKQLFQWLLRQKVPAVLEYFDKEIQQRPDIMFEFQGGKYALEYQWSTIPDKSFSKRTKAYLDYNYIPLWIIASKHIQQKKKDMVTLSNFHYSFLRSTTSGTLYIPTYSSENKFFDFIEGISPISIKNALAKHSFHSLNKMKLTDLLEREKGDSLSLSRWGTEVEKFTLNWALHPQLEQKVFFHELYNRSLNLFLLPPEIGLPVAHSILIQTPPIIWQTYLYLDILINKNPSDFISLQELNDHFNKRKYWNHIHLRNLPQLKHLNPLLALVEYLQLLELLGILAQRGENLFQMQKKIYQPSSTREKEEAKQLFYNKQL